MKKWNENNLNVDANNRLVRHYHLTGSYLADLTENLDVEPYTVLRATFINPIQFELGARMVIKEHFYGGIGYRYQDAFTAMLGTTYNNFMFGYSYDITTSDLKRFSTGTHEVMLGYRFKNKQEKFSKIN